MSCDSGQGRVEYVDNPKLAAALCAILTVLERFGTSDFETVIASIDWEEAGITEQWLRKWWEDHKAADRQRRKRERLEKERKEAKKRALAKLSPEEKKLLGL